MTKHHGQLRHLEAHPAERVRVHRTLRLQQAAGELRTMTFEEREHLVVPVIALVEGVIHPVNAETPELVLASELAIAPAGWNGEPVLWDHPVVAGVRVSAGDPRILETWMFGRVFNARLDGKKLKVDAWIDTARAAEMGGAAQDVIDRINAGELIEVSVGAFVVAEPKVGVHDGQRFTAIWREIVPDHLAMLPAGTRGACSAEMGCGGPRAAEAGLLHAISADGLLCEITTATDEDTERMKPKTLAQRFQGLASFFFRNSQAEGEGRSDQELRSLLEAALFATEPAFLGIEAVFPESNDVVYAVAPDTELMWFSRSYTVTDAGEITFGEATEVRPVTKFEPVTAASSAPACGCQDPAACECGTEPGETNMDKAQRIAALIANKKSAFGEADQAALEAMSDATLEVLEASAAEVEEPKVEPAPEPQAAAPAEPVAPAAPAAPATPAAEPVAAPAAEPVAAEAAKTDEELIAALPASLRSMIDRQQAQDAEQHAAYVALLDGAQDVFDKAQLEAKTIDQLKEIAALSKATPVLVADYSGIGTPRATERADEVPDPPDQIAAIKAAQDRKHGVQ